MSTRYDRLLSLSSFSEKDLKTLHSKKVLIIGAGGVGQHVATYLITNGIEQLTIIDYDVVEISNLNRQILLTEKDIGKPKVDVVKKVLLERNSDAKVKRINAKLSESNASDIITDEYDIVVDAIDNWEGKFTISDTCHARNIPFLHIGIDGMGGQFCVFKNKCLSDVLTNDVRDEKRDGVLGSAVGAISSIAATWLIEFLLNHKEVDQILSVDLNNCQIRKIKF